MWLAVVPEAWFRRNISNLPALLVALLVGVLLAWNLGGFIAERRRVEDGKSGAHYHDRFWQDINIHFASQGNAYWAKEGGDSPDDSCRSYFRYHRQKPSAEFNRYHSFGWVG